MMRLITQRAELNHRVAGLMAWVALAGIFALAVACSGGDSAPSTSSAQPGSGEPSPDVAVARSEPSSQVSSPGATESQEPQVDQSTIGPSPGAVRSSRAKIYTLVEKTLGADLILIGRVADVRAETIIVTVDVAISGTPGAQVELALPAATSFELPPPPVYEAGEQILLFANSAGDLYEPFAGSQGLVKIQSGEEGVYQLSIQTLLSFDESSSPEERTAALTTLLSIENSVGNVAGLEIIYRESHTNTFLTEPLIQPTVALTQHSDSLVAVRAVQVLERIGDKSAVPALIQALGSADSNVAETALQVLSRITRADIKVEFDAQQPPEARAGAVQQWEDWWEKNKTTVTLVK